MGFRYRKSFKVGGVRVTASKSGISYSTKIGGTRVTKRANGRVTATTNLGGGLSYTASTGSKKSKPQAKPKPAPARSPAARAPRTSSYRAAPDSPQALQELYERIYGDALGQLRSGEANGAALRGKLYRENLAHPKLLKAITDAERQVAKEARHGELVAFAVQSLEAGADATTLNEALKREHRVGFFMRRKVVADAKAEIAQRP